MFFERPTEAVIAMLVPLSAFLTAFFIIKKRKITRTVKQQVFAALLLVFSCIFAAGVLIPLSSNGLFNGLLQLRLFGTIRPMMNDILQYGILSANPPEWDGSIINYIVYSLSYAARNILGNTLLFMPLGIFFAPLVTTKKWLKCLIYSVLLPIFIELWQFSFTDIRTCDVDDILLNSISIFVGCAIMLTISKIRCNKKVKDGKRTT